MVRFGWHVEDGLGAHILPGEMSVHEDTQISHAICSIEVAEEKQPLQAIFTLPPNYLQHNHVRQVGVALAHGDSGSDWKGYLLTELAVVLAAQGSLVVRYHCSSSDELLRQLMYEKALDAIATSPYATSVEGWVLAGVGSGARVAAAVAHRCRGSIVGCAFLSYPLQEPAPVTAQAAGNGAPPPADSAGLLLGLQQPMLFVKGEADEQCPTDLLAQLLLSGHMSCKDARLLVVPDVDQHFRSGQGHGMSAPALQQVTAAIGQFVEAVTNGTLEACPLPRPTQQQAAMAPPGSLQPSSWLQQPGYGRGAAASLAPAQQPWRQPKQEPGGDAGFVTQMQQAHINLQAAAQSPAGVARGPQRPQSLQPVPDAYNDIQAGGWQQASAIDTNTAAPMQLDKPAAQRNGLAEQRDMAEDAVQGGMSDGQAEDDAVGAAAHTDASSPDYDSGSEGQQQQQVRQEWQQQQANQQDLPQLQPKQEQSSEHADTDGEMGLQQGLRNHTMPAMQQTAAAAQWQQQQHAAQLLSSGRHPGTMLMPNAQPTSSHFEPSTQAWQHAAAASHNPPAAGRPGLQVPASMLQQQVAEPTALASIGQVPLEQIWGQGAMSGNVLASSMAGHQQSATRPNVTDP